MASSAWALITGASGGIGVCFARPLGARRRNLVLVARSKGRLQELAGCLASECNVPVEPISLDLSETRAAARLAATLRERGLSIDLLVNNAGFGARLRDDPFTRLDGGLMLIGRQGTHRLPSILIASRLPCCAGTLCLSVF